MNQGRDDDDLATRAEGHLRTSIYPELRVIYCDSHEGTLVLRGRVPSYYLKQLAQEAVRSIEGLKSIVNVVVVRARHAHRSFVGPAGLADRVRHRRKKCAVDRDGRSATAVSSISATNTADIAITHDLETEKGTRHDEHDPHTSTT
jgi:hypothetical protein